jgi:CelD/BcsL family acetyltransferase involved in cellulose biosynthesis
MQSTGSAMTQGDALVETSVASAASAVRDFAVTVYDDLTAVEPIWRGFQDEAVCTAFQTFEWLSAWQRHIGVRNGVAPCIVIVRDRDDGILMILPLAVQRAGLARELTWLGAELCDYNAPLLSPHGGERLEHAQFEALWHEVLRRVRENPRLRFDMVRLDKMPEMLRCQPNPMLALPVMLHPSGSYATPLAETWDAFYAAKRSPSTRRRDRTKRNRLAALGEIAFVTPESDTSVRAALDVLIAQKSAFFAKRGIPNLFERPGYVEFYGEVAAKGQAAGLAHVSELKVGDHIAAVNFALTLGERYYYVLSSYTDDEMARLGPGVTHLHEIMRHAIEKRYTVFDFTVGDEPYKRDWCDGVQPLYDHVSAASPRGALVAAPALAVKKLKRGIKQSPLLWAWFSKARAWAGALKTRRLPATPGNQSEAA